jgi:molecular chaperone HtpG
MTEKKSGKHEFQADVKQLLDIVVHSLYTNKEIFIRELVSNSSDALEKLRYIQQKEKGIFDAKLPLEIDVKTDEEANTITISDYGIGMSREELATNLGTIAHSGSKQFLESVKKGAAINENLIGQFGVGFYSVFMVSEKVEVLTHSWQKDGEDLLWKSDGSGTYDIEDVKGNRRGTSIVVYLKEDEKDYSNAERVKFILKQYSSFVQFPIKLNGEQINTVDAIWLRKQKDITEDEYKEFYKFQSNSFDEPYYRLHFSSDAPIDINTLLFVPTENPELPGFGRIDPGVSLYCKKILIDDGPKEFLPEWLRFLKGVVDSADLPLNISRESMQDSTLMQNLGRAITKRFIKFLGDEAKKDKKKYAEFYNKFGLYIKEGASSDFINRESLQKLMRFETSNTKDEDKISFEEYVTGMKEGQKDIYYLIGNDREFIEKSPQMEVFKSREIEVIYVYEPIDDFVMNNVKEFDGKPIVSIDSAEVDLDTNEKKKNLLKDDKTDELCKWLKDSLGEKVEEIGVSKRLVSSPVVALNADKLMTNSMKRFMKAMNKDTGADNKVKLEINTSHKLIKQLNDLREKDEGLAKLVAEQLYDNSLLAAGFIEDPQSMVGRIYDILEHVSAK